MMLDHSRHEHKGFRFAVKDTESAPKTPKYLPDRVLPVASKTSLIHDLARLPDGLSLTAGTPPFFCPSLLSLAVPVYERRTLPLPFGAASNRSSLPSTLASWTGGAQRGIRHDPQKSFENTKNTNLYKTRAEKGRDKHKHKQVSQKQQAVPWVRPIRSSSLSSSALLWVFFYLHLFLFCLVVGGAAAAEAPARRVQTQSVALSSLDGTNGFVILGDEDDANSIAELGVSVAAVGDFNGDGMADARVGSHLHDPGGRGSAGEAYVVFGTNLGCGSFGSFQLSSLDGSNGFILNGVATHDNLGDSVASAGDINNDGIDDVMVGASSSDDNLLANYQKGAAYILFGKDTATNGNFDSTIQVSSLDGSNGFKIPGNAQNDFCGSGVSGAGDVNGDGVDDVVVGAYGADPEGRSSAGETYVIFGKRTATAGAFSTELDLSSLDGSNGFTVKGAASNDYSGYCVSGGVDVNGDGLADVLIGAYGKDFSKGAAYVIYGRNTATAGNFAASIDLSTLSASDGLGISGVDTGDEAGRSVSFLGDVNGDGVGDMLIGANEAQSRLGKAFVIFSEGYCGTGQDNCHAQAACTPSFQSFTCSCNSPYTGTGLLCNDFCGQGQDNCHTQAACQTNADGASFTCTCNSPYEGDGVSICNDFCGGNQHNCNGNATCTNTNDGTSFTCACNAGFAGDGIACDNEVWGGKAFAKALMHPSDTTSNSLHAHAGTSANECLSVGTCSSSQKCVDTASSYICDNFLTISCPSDTTTGTDPRTSTWTFSLASTGTASASDIEDSSGSSLAIVYSPADGSSLKIGAHTITATVTDSAGSTASCSFVVNVKDQEAPLISCPGTVSLSPSGTSLPSVSFPKTHVMRDNADSDSDL
eukprot:Cvel_32215.t1-p1 / transcript=Cvel_32215.t1 / gene=Cvel_32215 / organism=Chromera_velia_CCMP2878 / gene_product=Fibrillin-1, putative / transcript_product=Fibrillin-1, putative / location=Cvel_scaffold4959:1-5802(-) / protein_length=870 / sequence_SO=supercontig / SO=protein_coding / is_pseudo=false